MCFQLLKAIGWEQLRKGGTVLVNSINIDTNAYVLNIQKWSKKAEKWTKSGYLGYEGQCQEENASVIHRKIFIGRGSLVAQKTRDILFGQSVEPESPFAILS